MTEWIRPEHKDQENLETAQDFADRIGSSLTAVRGRFRNYADIAPEPVKIERGRLKFFLPEELDAFLEKADGSTRKARTPAEVAAAEVARLARTVAETEERVQKREREAKEMQEALKGAERRKKESDAAAAKARSDLKRFQADLRHAEERVRLA